MRNRGDKKRNREAQKEGSQGKREKQSRLYVRVLEGGREGGKRERERERASERAKE